MALMGAWVLVVSGMWGIGYSALLGFRAGVVFWYSAICGLVVMLSKFGEMVRIWISAA